MAPIHWLHAFRKADAVYSWELEGRLFKADPSMKHNTQTNLQPTFQIKEEVPVQVGKNSNGTHKSSWPRSTQRHQPSLVSSRLLLRECSRSFCFGWFAHIFHWHGFGPFLLAPNSWHVQTPWRRAEACPQGGTEVRLSPHWFVRVH